MSILPNYAEIHHLYNLFLVLPSFCSHIFLLVYELYLGKARWNPQESKMKSTTTYYYLPRRVMTRLNLELQYYLSWTKSINLLLPATLIGIDTVCRLVKWLHVIPTLLHSMVFFPMDVDCRMDSRNITVNLCFWFNDEGWCIQFSLKNVQKCGLYQLSCAWIDVDIFYCYESFKSGCGDKFTTTTIDARSTSRLISRTKWSDRKNIFVVVLYLQTIWFCPLFSFFIEILPQFFNVGQFGILNILNINFQFYKIDL